MSFRKSSRRRSEKFKTFRHRIHRCLPQLTSILLCRYISCSLGEEFVHESVNIIASFLGEGGVWKDADLIRKTKSLAEHIEVLLVLGFFDLVSLCGDDHRLESLVHDPFVHLYIVG